MSSPVSTKFPREPRADAAARGERRAADRFTLDVIQQALAAAANEMFATFRKTAMSPIIYEVLDVGTGITDARGNLVSSGAGIPGFVGVLDKTLKRLLELVPASEIAAGDIFVSNDPYYGGVRHLNDVVLAMPFFCGAMLIAWAANIGHWNDVGGADPGSMSVDARDIHAEGLRLPAIKLIDAGKPVEPVMKIMEEAMDDRTIWRAAIDISDDAFVVDLGEAPDQRADPLNTSRDGAVVSAQLIFKAATAPETVCNAGSFRPLSVLTRPGSIFEPLEPAAQGYYFEVRARLSDMLWHGLAKAAPKHFPAGHFASICGTVIAGRHPETGRRFAMVEPQMGGWGATATRDGVNAQFSSSHGDTLNYPVEIAEARYGFHYRRLSLNDEPGGEGRHHDGRGLVKEFAIRGPETEMSIGYSRLWRA